MYLSGLCFCRLPSRLRRRARRSRMLTMLLALSVVVIFLAPFYVIYKPPRLLIRYFQYKWPDVLWHADTLEKFVALTIDDAPSQYTLPIMNLLRENDATATFFVIGGQVPGKEDVLKELVRNGNELGNHAMHDEASRGLTDVDFDEGVKAVETTIDEAYDAVGTQHPPRYFRPGSGFFSTRMRKRLQMLKYRLVLGDVYPHDAQISYSSANGAHILSMLRPGSIIICHDRRSWTIPMLKKVIPEIKRRGYRITTVTDLVKKAQE